MECEKTRNDYFRANVSKNNTSLRKYYADKFRATTSIEIQSQNWGGNI